MHIRGMEAGFSSARACPLRLRTDQTHAESVRVVMNFPVGCEERIDGFQLKVVGRAMRPVEYANFAVV